MSLSSDLISQFVKATNDVEKPKSETTVYGTIVYDGKPYVRIDGSELLTPVSTTTDVDDGERVTVLIKDHTATVTGNLSSPSARTDTVKDMGKQITEFETVIAYKVSTQDLEAARATIEALRAKLANITDLEAVYADIIELEAKYANLEYVNAKDVEALTANIEKIQAHFGDFKDISAEELEALNAEITTLKGYTADYTYVSADVLTTIQAKMRDLDVKYATIDFSNIGEAAIEKLFTESGIIEDLVVSDGRITGELVGVTIKGNLIEGDTIVADKIVVRGDDGLYYKLNVEGETIEAEQTDQNSLNGSIITAKSITAGKVAVDDLVAFDATIGGFNITDTALYSGVKESVDNGLAGVYMDSDGQFAVGDEDNFIKFYKDPDGVRKLAIAAESITTQIKAATEAFQETIDKVNKHFSFNSNGLVISAGENTMTLRIDNDIIIFEKNGVQFGWWDGIDFHTGNIMIEVTERAQFGNFAFVPRTDGSLSFLKVEHKTGFYAINNKGTMVVYGAYPTLDGTTLVISDDMAGELDGTTLILNGG